MSQSSSEEEPLANVVEAQQLKRRAVAILADVVDKTLRKIHGETVTVMAKPLLIAMVEQARTLASTRYACNAVIHASQEAGDKNENLCTLAEHWLLHLILPMMAIRIRGTPYPPSILTPTLDDTASKIDQANRDQQRDLRKKLLLRENHRCIISNEYDHDVPAHIPQARVRTDRAYACHIIPLALNHFVEKPDGSALPDIKDASVTWDILKSWADFDPVELVGEKINDPCNAMLMNSALHTAFGKFQLYLEPTENPDEYKASYRNRTLEMELNGTIVQFQDHSGTGIPLPSPRFLAIHAAFARVLYACGAAEYVEKVWKDYEDVGHLRSDGSTETGPLIAALSELVLVR